MKHALSRPRYQLIKAFIAYSRCGLSHVLHLEPGRLDTSLTDIVKLRLGQV